MKMNITDEKRTLYALGRMILPEMKAERVLRISSWMREHCDTLGTGADDSYQAIREALSEPADFHYAADFYLDLYSRSRVKNAGYRIKTEADLYAMVFRILNETADYEETIKKLGYLCPEKPLVQALNSNTARWVTARYEGINSYTGCKDGFCAAVLISDGRILAHERKYYIYKKQFKKLKETIS